MAEQDKDRAENATATAPIPKAGPDRTAAVAEVLNMAESLRLVQQQEALRAMQLPDKRLDDASPDGGAPPFTLREIGDGEFLKVNAWGDEVNDKGELTARGKETAAARAQSGVR